LQVLFFLLQQLQGGMQHLFLLLLLLLPEPQRAYLQLLNDIGCVDLVLLLLEPERPLLRLL